MVGAMAGPGAAAPGARSPLPDFASSISRAMTRPCGPEPCTRLRSRLASLARRRASGEEKMRLLPLAATGCAAAFDGGAGCGAGAFGGSVLAIGFGVSASGAGADFAPLAAAFTSSPSPASTAITALTATSCVPSGTTILANVPSSTASYSIVALSVSISAMMSPDLILSPSFLSHLARLPFSIVGDSAGMRMLVGIALPVADGFRRLDHFGGRRQRELLEIGGVWHRHFLAGDARDRGVKIIEGALHQPRCNFGADARLRPALFDRDAAARFLHRGNDSVGVHRLERAHIDHFGIDAVFGEFVRRFHRVFHAHRPGNDGDIVAGARDARLANGEDKIIKLGYRR